MEPACSLKRERPIEYSLCIICQESKKEHLRCTESGRSALKNAATVRQTFKDLNNRAAIENIFSASQSKSFDSLKVVSVNKQVFQGQKDLLLEKQ